MTERRDQRGRFAAAGGMGVASFGSAVASTEFGRNSQMRASDAKYGYQRARGFENRATEAQSKADGLHAQASDAEFNAGEDLIRAARNLKFDSDKHAQGFAAADKISEAARKAEEKGNAHRKTADSLLGQARGDARAARRLGYAETGGKVAAIGLGLGAVGVGGKAVYDSVRKAEEIEKFLEGAKHKLETFQITPDQARHAGVMGQIGGGAGALTGAAVGTVIGAAAHKPATGAGIGAMAGGALGGSGGAALGLYAGRPRKKKKLVGQAPATLSKSFDRQQSKGAAIGAGTGLAAGAVIGGGAGAASRRLVGEAGVAEHLADYKRSMSNARMLGRTSSFHASPKGRAAVALGGAAVGTAIVRHHQRKIAGQIEAPAVAPIAKMSDDTKTKLARGGLIGAQLADVAAIKSAWHETSTATKTGEGVGAALSYGAKKAALPVVAGGLVASIGAERVMANQQKKLKAAQTTTLKPRKATNGMIAKSQRQDGSYAPISSMSAQDRTGLRSRAQRQHRFNEDGIENEGGHRDTKQVYRQYGVKDGLPKALKESTRESTLHRNIHFGDSIGPELEGQINHSLDRKLVAGLKRPVVFHHGEIHPAAAAAAAGAHATTGGKGRVIINSRNIDASGRLIHGSQTYKWGEASGGSHFHEVVNHELVHAAKVGKNPMGTLNRDLKTQHKKAMGEEARADGKGVRGRGLYQRNHIVESDRHIHADYGDTDSAGRTKGSRFHYNAVHDKVQDAHGTRLPGQGRSADAAFRRTIRGLPPKVTPQPRTHIPMDMGGRGLKKPVLIGAAGVGLAAGSKALYDHYHRDHSGKFAPGSNPSLRTH